MTSSRSPGSTRQTSSTSTSTTSRRCLNTRARSSRQLLPLLVVLVKKSLQWYYSFANPKPARKGKVFSSLRELTSSARSSTLSSKLSRNNTRNSYSNSSIMTRRFNIPTSCRTPSRFCSGTPRLAPNRPQTHSSSSSSSISGSKVRLLPSIWWSHRHPWRKIIPTLSRNTSSTRR